MTLVREDPEGPDPQFHGPMAWAMKYVFDWHQCNEPFTLVRTVTTILRWFPLPETRIQQLNFAIDLYGHLWRAPPAVQSENFQLLLHSTTELFPSTPRASLGLWLASLTDGSLIDGGPTPEHEHRQLFLLRPGFAYGYLRWLEIEPSWFFPWPFWIFPRTDQIE